MCVYIYKYNMSCPDNNDSTKLVISVRAGGKPPAGRITNFVLIIFWASYVIYLYDTYIYIYIYMYTYPLAATYPLVATYSFF